MDIEEIKATVEEIRELRHSDESAHIREDALHVKFIEFIAEQGSPELQAMAKEVLKTGEIPFCRWCA